MENQTFSEDTLVTYNQCWSGNEFGTWIRAKGFWYFWEIL